MTALDKAKQRYQENLRGYYSHKDIVEDFYLIEKSNNKKITEKQAKESELKMNQHYDVLETLTYIFGADVQ